MQAVHTNTGYAHGKDYTYLARQRPLGKRLAFNFSDRFREVFEFYFTGIELYNILKFFKLFQGHGATLYSDTIHLGWSSSFLHLHTSGSPKPQLVL